jgi:hypothetical protein
MLKTSVVLLVVVGFGYWIWTGPYEQRQQSATAEEEQLEGNAQTIQRCLNRESSMNAAAGMAGAGLGGTAEDTRARCAEKHGLYFAEGQWREIDLGDGGY